MISFILNLLKGNFLLISIFFFQFNAFAQHKNVTEKQDPFSIYTTEHSLYYNSDKPYYLISWTEQKPKSICIIRMLHEKTAVIKIADQKEFDLLEHNYLLRAANNLWKFSPALLQDIDNFRSNSEANFIITANSIEELALQLNKTIQNINIIRINKPSNSLVVNCPWYQIHKFISPLKEVVFIDRFIAPQTEIGIIGYSRNFHGINRLDYLLPAANGKNITVGVKEQKMESTDLDLYKRVVPSSLASANVSTHATVISSIIGGAGNSFYNGRGIANACQFYSSSFSNLFADETSVLNSNQITVQNHSYGTIIQQFYGAEALSYDADTWFNKNRIHVFSAGNSGKLAASEGKYAGITNYANLTGNFKMAKNIITVGAIELAGNIPAESSSGPVYDGRLAPQLVALGPNGTSDAAAMVSGTIAVMQQVYADSNNKALPPASLIKAILFNTAEDINRPGIDYKSGYGLVNSFAAVRAIQQKKYDGSILLQNQIWTKNIIVPANTAQLKITLAWTDSASSVNNNKALINDLDIELTEIATGNNFKPWVLSSLPNADSLEKAAIRKRDSLNTAEQITIQLPNAGNYQIKVTGTGITNSALPFHIAYQTDTLHTFTFTNPQHSSDVNRDENELLTIRWKTFVSDTNETGNLYISYDNGTNWTLIKQSLKIYANQAFWPIKDTASSALLKMETSFGIFYSPGFIISKVIRTKIDFICADSFQLSWNKHIDANAYKIYALADSPYLKHILTVTDTFKLFKRDSYPYLIYAVEPILNNNIPAARSIASHISLQGVNCFYKTLYYNQLDSNHLNLVLDLSAPVFVDSIFFERVTVQGLWLQTYGSKKITDNQALHMQYVNNLATGVTHFRCKLKLKNGNFVYTDIISILTSGRNNILFYPNPVRKNSTLNYLMMQGISTDNRIQFFDASGKMIRNFATLPTTISTKGWPGGLVFYKVYSQDYNLLSTGKIIIME